MVKKKLGRHETFTLRSSIILLVSAVLGCVPPTLLPEERYGKAEALVERGSELLRAGRFVEARHSYEVAAELAPVAAAIDGLGCIALLEGRYEEAGELFQEAYEMDEGYDEALMNLGLLRQLQGRGEEARAIYLSFLEKNPDSVRARNDLFALEYDQGRGTMDILREFAKAQTLSDDPLIRANVATLKER